MTLVPRPLEVRVMVQWLRLLVAICVDPTPESWRVQSGVKR